MRRRLTGSSPNAVGPKVDVGPAATLLVLGHQAARLLDRGLAAVDLSAGEAVLLLALRNGPLTMSGVMSTLHIKASTATSLVNRLESLGLVQRSPNPDDRRSLLVKLTEAGVERATAALPVFTEMDAAFGKPTRELTLTGVKESLDRLGDR